MPKPEELAKARLIELEDNWKTTKPQGRDVVVQFNPETLKVTYSNQVAPSEGQGSQDDPQKLQFVGSGTTKLAVQLWFDVSGQAEESQNPQIDVRNLTKNVAYFMTPKKSAENKFMIPALRFEWGSFSFDGVMDSLDETLEYFSADGIPLRASMSFGLTQQKIVAFEGKSGTASPIGNGLPQRGTTPLTPSREGESVQQMVARSPGASDWKAVASANGIENPRFVPTGTFMNLNPPRTSAADVRNGRNRV